MLHRANLPCPYGSILLLGEAPGEEEAREQVPFIGSSGEVLNELLRIVGLQRRKVYGPAGTFRDDRGTFNLESELHSTNVFPIRPQGNDIKALTLTKTELKKQGYSEAGRLPQLNKRYLHPAHEHHLLVLRRRIIELAPKLIIALGGTALWALTGDGRITQHRGTFFPVELADTEGSHSCQAIATFHPAMILRAWDQRPIAWADLRKAKGWLDGTLPAPSQRRLFINPTKEELEYCYDYFTCRPGELLGVDIETAPGVDQITTFAIGTPEVAICIPLWDKATLPELCNVYATASEEVAAWRWIERFCQLPNPKVLQNGLYDLQYLLDAPIEIRVRNVLHDTAILQHSLQPELPKDLGTLGSLYLNEPAWKFMRTSRPEDAKADE